MDVKDVVERETVAPPEPPKPRQIERSEKKWGANRRRPRNQERTSVFKASKSAANTQTEPKPSLGDVLSKDQPLSQREEIHLENLKKMAQMNAEEIEKEREELYRAMDPKILAGLLRRMQKAEINIAGPVGKETEHSTEKTSEEKLEEEITNSFDTREENIMKDETDKILGIEKADSETASGTASGTASSRKEPIFYLKSINDTCQNTVKPAISHSNKSVHFLKPKDPSLDLESDPVKFFSNLHKKYFPNLEVEPEKMAWMNPVSEEEEKEYHPELESLAPSQLRFDFKGNLITPSQSQNIPSSLGLHHHGDAPGAAGYTVLELAHLARSTNQGQRCLAIQTIGRIGYKVGKLNYGTEISEAIKELLVKGRLLQTLYESDGENVSTSVRVYATEALWLFNQGGLLEVEEVREEEEVKNNEEKEQS